jgi:DNA-binding CsgD family transcriptional regulator
VVTVPELHVCYVRDPLELPRLLEVDRWLGRPRRYRVHSPRHWIGRYSRGLLALKDEADRIWGRAACLPLRERAYREILAADGDLRAYLRAENILSDDQAVRRALDGRGNLCAVGIAVGDPDGRREDYLCAVPLLRELQALFYDLRVRALVCQSESPEQEKLVSLAGGRRVRPVEGGDRAVWNFDLDRAREVPASGLGVVFNNIWYADPREATLGLTAAQRRVVALTSQGYSDADAARLLFISPATVRKHWENALGRFRLRNGTASRSTREAVIAYCQRQPLELMIPGGRPAALPAAEA